MPEYYPDVKLSINPLHIDDFCKMHQEGKMIGSFVSGTASTVGKVHSLTYKDKKYEFKYEEQDLISELKKMVVDVQRGIVEHPFSQVLELDN